MENGAHGAKRREKVQSVGSQDQERPIRTGRRWDETRDDLSGVSLFSLSLSWRSNWTTQQLHIPYSQQIHIQSSELALSLQQSPDNAVSQNNEWTAFSGQHRPSEDKEKRQNEEKRRRRNETDEETYQPISGRLSRTLQRRKQDKTRVREDENKRTRSKEVRHQRESMGRGAMGEEREGPTITESSPIENASG